MLQNSNTKLPILNYEKVNELLQFGQTSRIAPLAILHQLLKKLQNVA